jgi:hypothetical protein
MMANWQPLLGQLRSNMLKHGIELPANPLADNRWHPCDGGHYYMFAQMPPRALFGLRAGALRLWQPDDRLFSLQLQREIAAAAASCPAERPTDRKGATVRPATKQSRMCRLLKSGQGDGTCDALAANGSTCHPTSATALAKAQTLLLSLLDERATPTLEIRERATTVGVSWMTVRRAAAAIGVSANRIGFGRGGKWQWELPRLSK